MTPMTKRLRILAVDDNRTNLHILQVFLKKLGHEIILAENGQEAVDKFESERPDIILLDIMMPIMDGFEAARRIKAHTTERWVPIIFLSALNRDENLLEGLEAGGDDYLTKPINFIVLEAKLRSMQRSLDLQQQSIDALNRLKTISDAVLEAIITIDTKGCIRSCNLATERVFGWLPEELEGLNVNVLMPEPFHSNHDAYISNYVQGGPPKIVGLEREVVGLRKDGSTFPAELGVSEIRLDSARMFVGVVRDISDRKRAEQKLRENAELLTAYYERSESEQQLAMKLVQKQLHRPGLKDPRLHYRVIPAQHFSGDVVAAARSPDGLLYAMLADATGHGLAAAISVIPCLSIFYGMTVQNRSLREIILEINQQMRESMPVGRFVAATFVCLDEKAMAGQIWVGGTPAAYLFDRWGRVSREFASTRIPLGIVDNREIDPGATEFAWEKENQLILCSDGLLEAENAEGKQFGTAGLANATANTSPGQRFQAIQTALATHLGKTMAADDISIMVIDGP